MGIACNLGILLAEALGRVDDDDTDVRAVDRHIGTQNTVLFNRLLHLALAADTCRVDEHKASMLIFYHSIGRITGGACDVRNNNRFPACNAVDQRGFARIRSADDGNGDAVFIVFFLGAKVQMLIDRIQQVAGAMSVQGGHRNRLSQTEVVKFVKFRWWFAHSVAFVDAQYNRLAALLQHCSDLLIGGGDAGFHIHHQNNDLCTFNRHLCLTAHLRNDNIIRIRLDTAGIDQHNLMVAPFAG